MRVPLCAFSVGILLAVCHAPVVSADPILITDGRRVVASAGLDGTFPSTDSKTPAAPFADFVAQASQSATEGLVSVSTVTTQRSSFGPRRFTASGTVDSSAIGGNLEQFAGGTVGSSLFDVEFDLPTPHRFALTGVIAVDRIDPHVTGFGEVDVVLRSLDIDVFDDGLRFGSKQLNITGVLPSGRHRFFIEAFTESEASGDFTRHTPTFDIDFALTPTPEPGSLFLLGGGLLALASKRLARAATHRS